MMYDRRLNCFVCIAESKSLTRAAEKLFISVPAVSQQLRSLEQYLGVQLFRRNNREVSLTPAGESLYRDAKALIELSEAAKKRLLFAKEQEAAEPSSIRFAYSGPENNRLLPLLSAFYLRAHPGVQLRFVQMHASELPEALLKGEADLAFIPSRRYKERKGLAAEEFLSAPMLCSLHISHPLSKKTKIGYEDLWGHTVLSSGLPAPNSQSPHARISREPRIHTHPTSSPEDLRILLHSGNYVSIQSAYNCAVEGELVHIPLDSAYRGRLSLIYREKEKDWVQEFMKSAKAAVEANRKALLLPEAEN